MPATIYDAWGEDGDFLYMDGAVGSGINIRTDTGFRTAYSRCGVDFSLHNVFGLRLWPLQLTTGWLGQRIACFNANFAGPNAFVGLVGANGLTRIILELTNSGNNPNGPFNVYKVNAAGALTLLGVTSSGFSISPASPDQLSINFDYSVSGFLKIYINSSVIFSYSGDITTDGETQLGGSYHGCWSGANGTTVYSECILTDSDTRDMATRFSAATGAGTVDQWAGADTNVNEIQVNDANFDTTTTSGDVQRYLMTEIATGNYNILAKVTSLRATQGGGTLTHIALDELIGGAEHTSAPVLFPAAFGNVTFVQNVNPATGVAWTQADINAAGRESGYKATA